MSGGRSGVFGRAIQWHPEVSSTNDVAALLADAGAPEGTAIVADAQSAGRGRLGRQWESPPGAGLYVSVVLRPAGYTLRLITIVAGVAVAEGIQAATGLSVALKWPNDVYVGERKLAGILAEAGTATGDAAHVVLGIGINVMPASLSHQVASRATSLESELGRPVDRGLLLVECLAALARRYDDLQNGITADALSAWRQRAAATMGRLAEWEASGGTRRGVAESIDDAGALLVRTAAGVERVI